VNTIATMALDLLCTLTFQPEGGHDTDLLVEMEQGWWQTLIHELDTSEKEQVLNAAQAVIVELQSQTVLAPHERHKLSTLEALVRGELS